VFTRSSEFKPEHNQSLVFSVDSYAATLGGINSLRNPRWILQSFFHMNCFAKHLSVLNKHIILPWYKKP